MVCLGLEPQRHSSGATPGVFVELHSITFLSSFLFESSSVTLAASRAFEFFISLFCCILPQLHLSSMPSSRMLEKEYKPYEFPSY